MKTYKRALYILDVFTIDEPKCAATLAKCLKTSALAELCRMSVAEIRAEANLANRRGYKKLAIEIHKLADYIELRGNETRRQRFMRRWRENLQAVLTRANQ